MKLKVLIAILLLFGLLHKANAVQPKVNVIQPVNCRVVYFPLFEGLASRFLKTVYSAPTRLKSDSTPMKVRTGRKTEFFSGKITIPNLETGGMEEVNLTARLHFIDLQKDPSLPPVWKTPKKEKGEGDLAIDFQITEVESQRMKDPKVPQNEKVQTIDLSFIKHTEEEGTDISRELFAGPFIDNVGNQYMIEAVLNRLDGAPKFIDLSVTPMPEEGK